MLMSNVPSNSHASSVQAGTARLIAVIPAALLSFFYAGTISYVLPLYFGTLREVAEARGGFYPADIYSQWNKYLVIPWIVGPVLAGLLARRYGERVVWSIAQIAMVLIPVTLALCPQPALVKVAALWSGLTGALMWIGGVSLVQMVPKHRKGLSNAWMMASFGLGGLLGPVCTRAILYRHELGSHLAKHNWTSCLAALFSFTHFESQLVVDDFLMVFWFLAGVTFVGGLLIGLWGQRPGRFEHDLPADWRQTMADIRLLIGNPRFWALVVALSVLGGPLFQASNQFLPYRAEDLGLRSGGQDFGWIWLSLLTMLMWIPGGAAVGLVAGRRAPGIAAVAMLAAFTVATLGIGLSCLAWQLFVCVALFEFVRQFMRWSRTGYLSEHVSPHLRATAIGCSISLCGLGSTIYGWAPSTSGIPMWPGSTLHNRSWPLHCWALSAAWACGCSTAFASDSGDLNHEDYEHHGTSDGRSRPWRPRPVAKLGLC